MTNPTEEVKLPRMTPGIYGGQLTMFPSDSGKYVRLSDAQAEIAALTAALVRIERWELPPTGKFWDEEKTRPTSFGAEHGSNGEREYMRAVARAAIDAARQTTREQP